MNLLPWLGYLLIMLRWTLGYRHIFTIEILFPLDKYQEVQLLGYMTVLVLIFWGTWMLFSIVAALICIPTNSVRGFPFLHVLANTCHFLCFWQWPFLAVWGDLLLWFWFEFPWWLVMLGTFPCACWPFVKSLENCLFSLFPLVNWVVCFSVKLYEFLKYIVDYKSIMLLFSHPVMSKSLRRHGLQHTSPPCPSPSPGVCPSSCPLHQWCYPIISSSEAFFSFCPQSFPASETFPIHKLYSNINRILIQ